MINVKTAPTAELVAYYNAHSGKSPIKKFADRQTAEKRVAALLPATTKTNTKPKGDGTSPKAGMKTTKVSVGGNEYKSTGAAFNALKLPLGRLIKFRMALKEAGKLDFEHDSKTYTFKVVA